MLRSISILDVNFQSSRCEVNKCQRPWALVQHMHQLVFFIRQFGQVKKDIKDHLVNDSSESSFIDDGIKLARRDSEIVSLLSFYIAPWL